MEIERIDQIPVQPLEPPLPPEETITQPPPENTATISETTTPVPEPQRVVDLLA
ncbi:MAG: hypothetical protein JW881_14315 [Spirochaetales bacterium]|nr:hypothetical protein [Spirochaetales bacterium]